MNSEEEDGPQPTFLKFEAGEDLDGVEQPMTFCSQRNKTCSFCFSLAMDSSSTLMTAWKGRERHCWSSAQKYIYISERTFSLYFQACIFFFGCVFFLDAGFLGFDLFYFSGWLVSPFWNAISNFDSTTFQQHQSLMSKERWTTTRKASIIQIIIITSVCVCVDHQTVDFSANIWAFPLSAVLGTRPTHWLTHTTCLLC